MNTKNRLNLESRSSRRGIVRPSRFVAGLLIALQLGLTLGGEALHRLYHQMESGVAAEGKVVCCCGHSHSVPADPQQERVSAPMAKFHCFGSDCKLVQLTHKDKAISSPLWVLENLDVLKSAIPLDSHLSFTSPVHQPWSARGPPTSSVIA